jgi:hypothetical protein
VFQFLKELYLTAFVVFFRTMNWSWTPRTSAEISICAAFSAGPIALIEWATLLGITTWIDVFAGTNSPWQVPKLALGITFMVLYAANFYPLVILRHGPTFEHEFTHLKKTKKVLLLTASVVVMLAAIAFFLYSAFIHRKLISHS